MKVISSIAVHPITEKQIEQFLNKPLNSFLLIGERGSGKLDLAKSIAARLLGISEVEELSSYPFFYHLKRKSNQRDIPIEAVREIIHTMRLKIPGSNPIRRVVLIEDADSLSREGQNALLKILEEPNLETVFILTARYKNSLLPTIVSRCQQVKVHPVSIDQAAAFYGSQYSRAKLESTWQISQGHASLLGAILEGKEGHPLKRSVEDAKNFLRMSKYERLIMLDGFKIKDNLEIFLSALNRILIALHHSAVNQNQFQKSNKLLRSRLLVGEAQNALVSNSNLKLITLRLVLNLQV